ncbi:G-type lectin S-receptor-like serine threonine-kinase At1g11300 isoform X2 [Olea europaea subsp. europaea]|uniref:non-specific serine/threonine protein kinase n=1 Tax=Olea europaea subsp. europaea TaxID=158383 RepID=A0A8S0Q2F9_OLEEU|nr:G-type lectin S-receptor-like serine threonine-kinase At1g11300 isoform X2 [Olea europaea subsp. europaea]
MNVKVSDFMDVSTGVEAVECEGSSGVVLRDDIDEASLDKLPLFSFEMLETATFQFDVTNLLGKGDFGPVYKGKLGNGKDIAVKRLSRASRQGLQEFMNEVVFISKLQHHNLIDHKRFLIGGIGRGLIYLHRDSRLKIVHRDLKLRNILHDECWTPKISNFGMARIFRGNQDHAKNGRVVGI